MNVNDEKCNILLVALCNLMDTLLDPGLYKSDKNDYDHYKSLFRLKEKNHSAVYSTGKIDLNVRTPGKVDVSTL